jgi:hypothetical protein
MLHCHLRSSLCWRPTWKAARFWACQTSSYADEFPGREPLNVPASTTPEGVNEAGEPGSWGAASLPVALRRPRSTTAAPNCVASAKARGDTRSQHNEPACGAKFKNVR